MRSLVTNLDLPMGLSSHVLPLADVPVENQTLEVGRSLTFKCNYSGSSGVKRICRGPLQYCQQMLNTSRPTNGRYHMEDATNNHTLTITIKSLIEQDRQGPFWCYSKNSDGTLNIHSKLNLTFGESPSLGRDGTSLVPSFCPGPGWGCVVVRVWGLPVIPTPHCSDVSMVRNISH